MIGVFDSGYGGLSVFKELVKTFPGQSFMYLGDNARAPYGIRSSEIVTEYVKEAVTWLFGHGATTIVLACNTASAEALPSLQKDFLPKEFPGKIVLGVIEPTVEFVEKNVSKENVIAVIGTPATIRSGAYGRAFANLGFTNVVEWATPLLVPLVETGTVSGPMAEHIIADALSPLTRKGVDAVVLGCTHYYFLRDTIQKLYPHLKLFDASLAFPSYFKTFLESHSESFGNKKFPSLSFYTTDEEEGFAHFVEDRLGFSILPSRVKLT